MKLVAAACLSLPLVAALFAACSSAETVDPVPVGTTTTTTTEPTSEPPDGGPPPDGAPAKRTMGLRNPLGGPANNLLVDGDFELSSSPYGTGQYGWRMFTNGGTAEAQMLLETGGLCLSGVSCVKLRKGSLLLGRGTAAAAGKGHVMGLSAHLGEGVPCGKINPIAIECDTFKILKSAGADQPFTDGWCHYAASFGASDTAICVYVQNTLTADQEAIIDAAVLGPDDGTVVLKATPAPEPDAETLTRLATLRDQVRRTTPFGVLPRTTEIDPRGR